MKKILLCALFVAICAVSSANAFMSCENGSVITRNMYTDKNAPEACKKISCPAEERKFCISNEKMTWKEAIKWCRNRGGSLAYFSRICPTAQARANNAEGACIGMQGAYKENQWAWTSFATDKTNVLCVNFPSGGLVDYPRNHMGLALCE